MLVFARYGFLTVFKVITMVLTDNDKQTIELILTNLKGKEKLSDEERLFKRFYEEYQNSNGGLSRDGQKFIRAFIKDFRYQQNERKNA